MTQTSPIASPLASTTGNRNPALHNQFAQRRDMTQAAEPTSCSSPRRLS
jgi:hypothetical protein